LGEFNAEGLGNLNAREVDIEVGLGSADIDFRGEITKNIEIDIKVGMGSLDLVLPENVNVKAKVHHNFLSSVDLDDFIKKGNQYLTEDWNSDWPTVYLDISVGLGSIDVNRR
jgi:predicted membrane protein